MENVLPSQQRKRYTEKRKNVIEILQKVKKKKKENMLTTKIKMWQTWIEEEGKNT